MAVWIIEPYEPLIFRDGRPFGMRPGTRAHSLPFPFPSTLAGAVRSRAGWKDGNFTTNLSDLKKLRVRGPLLVTLPKDERGSVQWLLPTPSDALFFQEKAQGKDYWRKPALPITMRKGDSSDLQEQGLQPLGATCPDGYKVFEDAPRYWSWKDMQQWLCKPVEEQFRHDQLDVIAPQREQRVHISYNGEAHTARESILFETSGLEFAFAPKDAAIQRLALAVFVDEINAFRLPADGPDTLGSERRTVYWQRSNDAQLSSCPKEIADQICLDGACRVLLLTPAYFTHGSIPSYLTEQKDNVTPHLISIASRPPQIVSGWISDGARKYPKPSRQLVPAGSVFFLKLDGSPKYIRRWIEKMWLRSMNDRSTEEEQQFCNDGFGLALLGTWNANTSEAEGEKHP